MSFFTITNHWLDNAASRTPSKNIGGRIEPQVIVVHETASHLTYGNAANWLANPASRVSAHVTVERDGRIIQLVPFDVAAWHSGASSWDGRCDAKGTCNSFSIGIELVGPGKLTRRDSKTLVSSFGKTFPIEQGREIISPAHGGKGWWLPFTDAQITATIELVQALLQTYPSIRGVVGHYEIAPGRKVDPAPTFPMDVLKVLCADRAPLDRGLVLQTQRRLAALFYDVGEPDGWAGPKLRTAVKAFQEQNGLPQTGDLDGPTLTKIGSPTAVAMPTGTRAETTKADVVSTETKIVKGGSVVQAGIETANASMSLTDALAKASKAKTSSDQASAILAWITSPAGLRSLAVLAICGLCWYGANRVDWARVKARIRGLTTRSA